MPRAKSFSDQLTSKYTLVSNPTDEVLSGIRVVSTCYLGYFPAGKFGKLNGIDEFIEVNLKKIVGAIYDFQKRAFMSRFDPRRAAAEQFKIEFTSYIEGKNYIHSLNCSQIPELTRDYAKLFDKDIPLRLMPEIEKLSTARSETDTRAFIFNGQTFGR